METQSFKIVTILPLEQGKTDRGEWKSQEVILESTDNVQYPDQFLVRFSGERTEMLNDLQEGNIVIAKWASRVRTFATKDGRQMHSQVLNGWKIETYAF